MTATKSGAVEHVEDHSPPENVASIVTFKAFYQDILVLSIWWLSPFTFQFGGCHLSPFPRVDCALSRPARGAYNS